MPNLVLGRGLITEQPDAYRSTAPMSAYRPKPDIRDEPVACPLMTLSGHSVEYAVRQVGRENQGFAYTFK